MAQQAGFRQINVALDAAQAFVVGPVLVAELGDGATLLAEREV